MTSSPGSEQDRDPASGRVPDRRLRLVAIVLAVGLGLAVVGAVVTGMSGGSGAVAAVVLLLVLGTTFAIGALLALGTAVVDEFRGRTVSRGRVVVGLVLFVATVVVMAMAGAAGG
ncbi:hypothetical protein [Salsipaludibacter albus]|uniref:hypothetical protein n=1 Tax=Salsipaludibacter albus TaxID=2849650 RepID=UPI001EE477B9|nr:hypothetical protein [Salsipaludibacter albus]MBY5161648.1 hypothetical protein [Salsipaludibacter albus]